MGNPNLKTGGLNRYCKDLAESQCMDGHDVFVLYPGSFIESKKPHIVKETNNMYVIRDALPMAITYGIDSPGRYMVTAQRKPFKIFLDAVHPDVIHVHSIQGIHKEFFEVANEQNIPMLFTTHDYYPICLRCVLLKPDGKICDYSSANECASCNQNAGLSINKQRVIQSDIYQKFKSSSIVRKLKAQSAKSNQSEVEPNISEYSHSNCKKTKIINEFDLLLKYYSDIMHYMSVIHCNSSISYNQYNKYYSNIPMRIIPITHSNILRSVHRRKNKNVLNISYMGGMSIHKGYRILMKAVQNLRRHAESGWILWLYGGEYVREYKDQKIQYKGLFTSEEEDEVWSDTDLLIVCSQWMETFGFIVLEALSRGIPVLCSDLVGCKDLITSIWKPLVFQHDNADELAEKMERFLDVEYYENIRKKIDAADIEVEMEMHSRRITNLYREIITS